MRPSAGFARPALLALLLAVLAAPAAAQSSPRLDAWRAEWPRTDFERRSVPFEEIVSGGVARDQIPPIDEPVFVSAAEAAELIKPREPVISVALGGESRAYPLAVLIWHEIVNDEIAGMPVSVTYCPLCDAAVVFDRRLGGRVLDFGTTGKLRNSDLVMWDRQTESWWQQFLGEAIVGELAGERLRILPSRVESFERFAARAGDGARVLMPNDPAFRSYGSNPYSGYDGAHWPFLFRGDYDTPAVPPLARVAAVGREAWLLELLRERRRIEHGDLVITWEPGQASALDKAVIAEGRDIGNVVVRRRRGGELVDAVHDVTFAFAFRAFRPDGTLYIACAPEVREENLDRGLACG